MTYKENLNLEPDLSTEELWTILSKVCTEQQIRQNNWRKLHGIPMKRKLKKKKSKMDRKAIWMALEKQMNSINSVIHDEIYGMYKSIERSMEERYDK